MFWTLSVRNVINETKSYRTYMVMNALNSAPINCFSLSNAAQPQDVGIGNGFHALGLGGDFGPCY